MNVDERVVDVQFSDDAISVSLRDGRVISVPLVWYPRLLDATAAQRNNWKIAGGGYGIHWPDIDEDLSTEGLLRGAPAPRVSVFFEVNYSALLESGGPPFEKRERWGTPSGCVAGDSRRGQKWATLYNRVGVVKGHVECSRLAALSKRR